MASHHKPRFSVPPGLLTRPASLLFAVALLITQASASNAAPTSHSLLSLSMETRAAALADQASTATVRFAAPEYSVAVGETITVDVIIENADSMGGWQALLFFDPTYVDLAEMTPGGFLSSTGRTAASLGPQAIDTRIAVGGYSYGTEVGVSGTGVLAHLRLNALAAGETDLSLIELLLAKVAGSTVTAQPGTVQSTRIKVIPAALAVAIQVSGTGNDVELSWQAWPGQADFEVWKSTQPYFGRGAQNASDITASCNANGGSVHCVDAEAGGNPNQNSYYLISSLNASGQVLAESRVGVFGFVITPGASLR